MCVMFPHEHTLVHHIQKQRWPFLITSHGTPKVIKDGTLCMKKIISLSLSWHSQTCLLSVCVQVQAKQTSLSVHSMSRTLRLYFRAYLPYLHKCSPSLRTKACPIVVLALSYLDVNKVSTVPWSSRALYVPFCVCMCVNAATLEPRTVSQMTVWVHASAT